MQVFKQLMEVAKSHCFAKLLATRQVLRSVALIVICKQIISIAEYAFLSFPKSIGNRYGEESQIRKKKDAPYSIHFRLSIIRTQSKLSQFYHSLVARGKAKMVAIVALMRKLIVIANAKIKLA